MDKVKEVKQIINNYAFPSVYYDGKINQGFIKDIDGTFDRIAEKIVKLFAIPIVTKRVFNFDYTGNGYVEDGNLIADLLTEKILAYDEEHAILLFKTKFVNVPFDPPY